VSVSESDVEEAAIEYLGDLGYNYLHGSEIAPDGVSPERASYSDVILAGRLRAALARINPDLDSDSLDEAAKRVLRPESPSLEENNVTFQTLLTRGVNVQVRRDGPVRGDQAWLIDFENPENNDWLVVNQFTVIDGKYNRRPDLIVFVNGMPLAVIELKNPTDQNATVKSAWNQLQTYKAQIPALFDTNELLVISDGTEAKLGSLTAGFERFGPWRTVDGKGLAPDATPKLEVLIKGLFDKRRFLDYIRHFVLWETEDGYVKKIAGYHQYHAVNKAIEQTIRASREDGDKRIGVVWHTQGSGKSVSMAYFTGKLVVQPEMKNPTVVVVTDRNDLDGQLFGQFAAAKGLMPPPEQAESREHLKELLQVASGGIVFSTMQKFGTPKGERYPELSDRRNIVMIADEAHRSHYEFVEGMARNLRDGLPNASFIGFTGTPIEFDDKSTPAVFGDYIDTYTISQSVEDKATVPIFYEGRLAKIALPDEKKPSIDEEFEEVTEGEEESVKGKLKSRWAKIESMVGSEERLALIAQDIVDHFDRRTEILEGKAMVVAMSRRIAVDLYEAIVKLRPEWDAEDDEDGQIKVIMTGSASDPPSFQKHVRNKARRKGIEKRFKDENDPLKMVIVRDMWLTGFDVPSAHTLYVDKPMKGHGLMQAIARVNRVFKDKPSGLVVDYIGLAEQLRRAVGTYGGRKGEKPGLPVEVALGVLEEKVGVVRDMFHEFDYSGHFSTKASERVATLAGGANHICGRGVSPLSDAERGRLKTIFADWRHPEVRDSAEQAARLGDGSQEAAGRALRLLESFLIAEDLGEDNELLYESTLKSIHRLLAEPAPDKLERISATKELVLQVEPLAFKLLALIAPDAWEKLKSKRKGLDTALIQLGKLDANPYSLKLSPEQFIERTGGETWTSFEHSVRDVVGVRLDTAHRSMEIDPHLWRSTLCVMLGLIDHNAEHLTGLPEVVPAGPDRKKRFMTAMAQLNKAAGIAVHLEAARDLRDDIGYFQAVQSNLQKYSTGGSGKTSEELNAAIRQIISGAVSSDEVVDIFGAAGLKKPDISILSDQFLETVKESAHPNLQLEVLKKLLNDEIRTQGQRNVVLARRFSDMLEQTLLKYQNRTLEAAQIILELIELAKEMREAPKRGDALGLSEDELAFYDALADHGDVKEVMGDDVLASIAHDLVEAIRQSVTIDWTQKEAVRAKMRLRVKRLLRKHGYPPDDQAAAVLTVIEQAERVCKDWSRAA
jgi:type I restriction enzyme, R subunit